MPIEIQDGAADSYYNHALLDGTRLAIYFVNPKDVGDEIHVVSSLMTRMC